jgi:hypothetical protein
MMTMEQKFTRTKATGEVAELLDVKEQVYLNLADKIERLLPDGREKALAITKLEESAMWASAAITRAK